MAAINFSVWEESVFLNHPTGHGSPTGFTICNSPMGPKSPVSTVQYSFSKAKISSGPKSPSSSNGPFSFRGPKGE